MEKISSSCRKFIKYSLIILFWLLIWEVANALIESNIAIVSPRVAFARLFYLGQTFEFWASIATSLRRIMQGFLLAFGVGVIIATISVKSQIFYQLISPAINVINAIPIASFTIIALLAFSSANLPIFIAFVTVLPIIFYNTHKGIVNTDPLLLEMAAVFDIPLWKRILYIYFKSVAPYLISAASIGIGFAWKSGIAAELIGVVRGTVGANLHNARIFLLTADLFAWTIAIVLLSYAMERFFRLIFSKVMK